MNELMLGINLSGIEPFYPKIGKWQTSLSDASMFHIPTANATLVTT